jgi:hypothetical protein
MSLKGPSGSAQKGYAVLSMGEMPQPYAGCEDIGVRDAHPESTAPGGRGRARAAFEIRVKAQPRGSAKLAPGMAKSRISPQSPQKPSVLDGGHLRLSCQGYASFSHRYIRSDRTDARVSSTENATKIELFRSELCRAWSRVWGVIPVFRIAPGGTGRAQEGVSRFRTSMRWFGNEKRSTGFEIDLRNCGRSAERAYNFNRFTLVSRKKIDRAR